jgi:hypothetical protein
MVAPKVFVSHAGEDKDRFVLGFASKLRANGVDAWLDKWEMRPGDKLIDKIFEQGIRNADAFIVVLSKNSVGKPWVREEMDAAFVKRVNDGSKLIPVVIEECDVPEALKSTVWETIPDLNNYSASLDRILEAIFGSVSKPPIGAAPSYAAVSLTPIAGITKTDTLILKASCELITDTNRNLIDPGAYPHGSLLKDIPKEVLIESLEILEHNHYVKQSKHMGAGPYAYRITSYGFEEYCQAFVAGYEEVFNKACFELVNNKPSTNLDLQTRLGVPLAIVDHILERLNSGGHLLMGNEAGERQFIVEVRVTLKRALEGTK